MIFRNRRHQRRAVPLDDGDAFRRAYIRRAEHTHIERALAELMELFE